MLLQQACNAALQGKEQKHRAVAAAAAGIEGPQKSHLSRRYTLNFLVDAFGLVQLEPKKTRNTPQGAIDYICTTVITRREREASELVCYCTYHMNTIGF